MVALRHLILMAVAFHHSRPASAKSVPGVGGKGKHYVQSTSANIGRTTLPPHPNVKASPTVRNSGGVQQHPDLAETANDNDADTVTVTCTWTGSDWQPLRPSLVPVKKTNLPGDSSGTKSAAVGQGGGHATTDVFSEFESRRHPTLPLPTQPRGR